MPSFKNASSNSELTALVSDDPTKLEELGDKYGVAARYTYDHFEQALPLVDAVYIGLPNHLHRDYTERAAAAGVHVLCEKPMALTEEDCEAMIRAAENHQVKLMIAYRLHLEEANLRAIELAQSGQIGELRYFNSCFSQQVPEGNIRLRRETGGGTLYDIGIYCINASRYLFRDEPVEVMAWTARNGEKRFEEVEEMTTVMLRMPGERLAAFTCSFGAASTSTYELVGTKGSLRLDPAYDFDQNKKLEYTVDGKTRNESFARSDQFGPQLEYFSDCILHEHDPEPSGVEGLADIRVIRALYASAAAGHPVRLDPFTPKTRPAPGQEITRRAVKPPDLVHAEEPSQAA